MVAKVDYFSIYNKMAQRRKGAKAQRRNGSKAKHLYLI
jgi:hypothetical protein